MARGIAFQPLERLGIGFNGGYVAFLPQAPLCQFGEEPAMGAAVDEDIAWAQYPDQGRLFDVLEIPLLKTGENIVPLFIGKPSGMGHEHLLLASDRCRALGMRWITMPLNPGAEACGQFCSCFQW